MTLNAPDTVNTSNPAATALATISGPATPSSEAQTYTSSGVGSELTAGATYFIVVAAPDAPGGSANYYWMGFPEDANAVTLTATGNGWSFVNWGREFRGNSWGDAQGLRMKLTVTAVPK